MQNSLVKVDPMAETELVPNHEPVIVRGSLQLILPSTDKYMRILSAGITSIQSTLANHSKFYQSIFDQLGVMNTTLYQQRADEGIFPMDDEIVNILQKINTKMDALAGVFASLPEWIPAHTLQESTGLGADAIRQQIKNPKYFEPEVDYKQIGKIWHINKNAIPKIRRRK